MLFNSYVFLLCFLPLTLLGYFILAKFRQMALVWLVVTSLFFYAWWDPSYLALILLSMFVNYALGQVIIQKKSVNENAKPILIAGLVFNLGLIGFFKYSGLFVQTVNTLFYSLLPVPEITLPLAISFFTFQQIAYLMDISKGIIPKGTFGEYCLFICFFPQLIAGPIVHHQEVIPQFKRLYVSYFNYKNMSLGLALFALGLFKKLGLADQIAPYANVVFDNAHELTFFEAWGGALAYTFQLYFDFSGYSDMAIGLGRMFNIKLPINFNSPYKATNIIDFWRRWHITLSRFLRDYLYIPLGGNRKGPFYRYRNLMITMLLGGLWHGASWTFMLWGGLHGMYLMLNHFWIKLGRPYHQLPGYKTLCHLLTFIVVVIAWVPFRADDFNATMSILHSMLSISEFSLPSFLSPWLSWMPVSFGGMFKHDLCDWHNATLWLLALTFISFKANNSNEWLGYQGVSKGYKVKSSVISFAPTKTWAFMIATLLLLSLILMAQESEFLYFQF